MNHDVSNTLYVSDLDGTLLGSDSKLSEHTVQLLNHAITRLGAQFTVATARTPATVTHLLERVHTKLPMIVMSGAAMWLNGERRYEHVQAIDPADVSTIVGIFSRHGLCPFVYRRHGELIHVHHTGAMSPQEAQFVNERTGLELKQFIADGNFDAVCDSSDGDAMLIFSMQNHDLLEPVYREVTASTKCSAMFYRDIFDHNSAILEIYRPGTTKAAAIERLARQVGAERTVVFGDNGNDLAMMSTATWSVAVANAIPEVKKAASEVIGPNTDDAVARWIVSDIERNSIQ